MKRFARWLLFTVLAIDAAVVAAFLAGGLPIAALTPEAAVAGPEAAAADDGPAPGAEALRRLGRELAERQAELDRREAELDELLRGAEVLRRAGLWTDELAGEAAAAPGKSVSRNRDAAFLTLQRAYENMEPDSAARALAALAARDRQAVVELLLGWKPRTSGAILDALTRTDPELSADLSYEIWRSGAAPGSGGG